MGALRAAGAHRARIRVAALVVEAALPLLLEQARSASSRQRSMRSGDSTTGDRRARDSFDTRPGGAPVLLRSDSDESPAVSVSNLVTNAASARRSSSRCCRAYAMITPQHRSCIIRLGLGERLEVSWSLGVSGRQSEIVCSTKRLNRGCERVRHAARRKGKVHHVLGLQFLLVLPTAT
jgi:hypothetical protein